MATELSLLFTNNKSRGFQAFDGTDKYFKRLTLWDVDCCFGEYPPLNLLRGRKTDPGPSDPDDGYFSLEKEIKCCCPTGRLIVVESVRWYATFLPVGTILDLPAWLAEYSDIPYDPTTEFILPRRWIPVPVLAPGTEYVFPIEEMRKFPILDNPLNTATFGVVIVDDYCCNEDGSKEYVELTNEINTSPGLVIKDNALVLVDSQLRFSFTYTTTVTTESGVVTVTISGILSGTVDGNIINVNNVESFIFNVDGVNTEEIVSIDMGSWSSNVGAATGYAGPVLSFDGSVMDLFVTGEINDGSYWDFFLFGPASQADWDNGIVSMSFWPFNPIIPDLNGENLAFNPAGWNIVPLP